MASLAKELENLFASKEKVGYVINVLKKLGFLYNDLAAYAKLDFKDVQARYNSLSSQLQNESKDVLDDAWKKNSHNIENLINAAKELRVCRVKVFYTPTKEDKDTIYLGISANVNSKMKQGGVLPVQGKFNAAIKQIQEVQKIISDNGIEAELKSSKTVEELQDNKRKEKKEAPNNLYYAFKFNNIEDCRSFLREFYSTFISTKKRANIETANNTAARMDFNAAYFSANSNQYQLKTETGILDDVARQFFEKLNTVHSSLQLEISSYKSKKTPDSALEMEKLLKVIKQEHKKPSKA